jgi:hypothetical protein
VSRHLKCTYSAVDGNCPVCLLEYDEDGEGVIILCLCQHTMHLSCMQDMIQSQAAGAKVMIITIFFIVLATTHNQS